METRFVIFDLETTGLNTKTCEVAEIAGVLVNKELEVIDTYSTLVQVKNLAGSTKFHGITQEMLDEEGIPPEDAITKFHTFAKNYPLIGHNAITYDSKILFRYYRQFDLTFNSYIIDTLHICRHHMHFAKNSLDFLRGELNLLQDDAHRALADCFTTKELLEYICKVTPLVFYKYIRGIGDTSG